MKKKKKRKKKKKKKKQEEEEVRKKKKKKKNKGPPSLQLLGKSLAQNVYVLKHMQNTRRLRGKSTTKGTKTSATLKC